MGGLPLALDQVGAYIEETACGLTSYLEIYEKYYAKLLKERGGAGSDHPKAVATTWTMSFELVQRTNPAAAELLQLCAFLHPDAIPENIITQGASSFESLLLPVVSDQYELNKVIKELLSFSLIQRNSDPNIKTLTIHRLIQIALKEWMGQKAQHQWAVRAVQAVNHVFPDPESATWQNCQRYLPHVYICATIIEEWKITIIEAAELLYRAALYLHKRIQYSQAKPLYQQALKYMSMFGD
jgi:hypothetical protein